MHFQSKAMAHPFRTGRVAASSGGYERSVGRRAQTKDADQGGFVRYAKAMVRFTGSGWAAALTVVAVAVWFAVGWALDFSRGWELVVTAGLPMLTLLLLIVVQHTQNHDNLAMQLKLDELIRASERTQDEMMRVEDASFDHLENVEREFKAHVEQGR
jgi:low affinity Fe/Cu permease